MAMPVNREVLRGGRQSEGLDTERERERERERGRLCVLVSFKSAGRVCSVVYVQADRERCEFTCW